METGRKQNVGVWATTGFSSFISDPSGKCRTAVFLTLGHGHFLAHPFHFSIK
jgi:hypothetical protein